MLPNEGITPGLIAQIARRRATLLVVPPLVGLFLAVLYSSTIPNSYQSEMLIAIIPQRVPDTVVRTTVTLRADERLDEISVVVMSRTNLESMIQELDLYPTERRRLQMNDVIGIMRANLQVGLEPQRRGPRGPEPPHAFHIRFTYDDPQMAALVTQKIGAIFVEENARSRGVLADETTDFLDDELSQARRRLEEQERRLEQFRELHGRELPTQLQSNMEAVRGLQLQAQSLTESIARDRDRKLMLERLYREASTDVPRSASVPPRTGQAESTGSTSLQRQLATARASLATLETRYTAEHPDVRRARGQIADLERRVELEEKEPAATQAAAAEPLDPIEVQRRENLRQMLAEIESLDRQTAFKESEERRIRSEIDDYQRRIEAVPGIESEWVALSRDYETTQATYRELRTKAEAARMAANLEQRQIGEQFKIVDEAQVPVHPVRSIRAMVNGGGLLLGLLVGAGIAAMLEVRDQSFRTETDVIEVLALPVLASVPRVISETEQRRQRTRRYIVAAVAAVCVAGAGYLTWSLRLWNSLV